MKSIRYYIPVWFLVVVQCQGFKTVIPPKHLLRASRNRTLGLRTTLLRYRGDSTASRDEIPNSNVLQLTASPPLIGIVKDGALINHVEPAPHSIVPIQTIITHEHEHTHKHTHRQKSRLFFREEGMCMVDESERSIISSLKPWFLVRDSAIGQGISNSISNVADAVLRKTGLYSLDIAVALCFMLSAIVINAPTVLLPVMAADPALVSSSAARASFAVTITSIATLGGAVGRFVNGFVCQSAGPRKSSLVYLAALSLCTIFLSLATSMGSVAVWSTALEFFHSIMWTASLTILSKHYQDSPIHLAKSITALSLGCTSGAIIGKVGLAALLQTHGWRTVARLLSIFSIMSMSVVLFAPGTTSSSLRGIHDSPNPIAEPRPPFSLKSIWTLSQAVFRNKLFWMLGVCHAISYLARSSDKILGSFLFDMTNLPRHICGGLTSFVTLGFVYGLVSGQAKFQSFLANDTLGKRNFFIKRYIQMVASALGLAVCASLKNLATGIWMRRLMATSILGCSMSMAMSISFQFYQFPSALASSQFKDNRSVCLSTLDSMGFLFSAPIWAMVGRMVSSMPTTGWTGAWTFLAMWFGLGGIVAMNTVPHFMDVGSQKGSST